MLALSRQRSHCIVFSLLRYRFIKLYFLSTSWDGAEESINCFFKEIVYRCNSLKLKAISISWAPCRSELRWLVWTDHHPSGRQVSGVCSVWVILHSAMLWWRIDETRRLHSASVYRLTHRWSTKARSFERWYCKSWRRGWYLVNPAEVNGSSTCDNESGSKSISAMLLWISSRVRVASIHGVDGG